MASQAGIAQALAAKFWGISREKLRRILASTPLADPDFESDICFLNHDPLAPLKILIVDDDLDSRYFISRALIQSFPQALLLECQSADSALSIVRSENLGAIISHRTTETAGISLIREMRKINTTSPILMISSIDRTEAALAAGANAFLPYDQWMKIGEVLGELMSGKPVGTRSPLALGRA